MHALWVSLKDNVKCGTKLTDVIRQPAKWGKGSICVSEKEKMNGENCPPMETPAGIVVPRPNNTLARLHGKLFVAPICMKSMLLSLQNSHYIPQHFKIKCEI